MKKEEPHHFSLRDFLKATLGSLILSLTFIFKGSMFEYAEKMNTEHILAVILATCLIVTVEIYMLSYRFVKNRKERPFSEFWAKRFFTIITSSFVTIWIIIHLYGIDRYITPMQEFKFIIAVLMPAAVAGAAIEILKKK
jgi:uncharacterized membrane protein